ncbi:hypothetical protein P175DRAFT_0502074 [Aspergillus ochraceoroseus IBT 24754]|uniref:Mitochondrial import inner membrane translocase subunit n=1 Tax=Aspergillus ochraceoroseus IBT 24754 TaxID=1392256 RepID=A0A2T5LUF1_9EURO|nr:uncharacterized protein P175DRAFT_0502074 [Aspergillus ochraceoroseus IBT 24754]PTU19900.1 hypothetical protein P175DRAFT_0502074 [Aspergillus ochraceoroseus IBT 24754]
MDGLTASEQREFAARMERKQMKEFMTVRFPRSQALSFHTYLLPSNYQISDFTIQLLERILTAYSLAFSLQMYSKLVQRCFDDCVNDFTTKSLISREEGCVMRCVDKFLKSSGRLNERFQEQNAAMMQSGQLPGR